MTLDVESWANACRWAFRQTFGHEPAQLLSVTPRVRGTPSASRTTRWKPHRRRHIGVITTAYQLSRRSVGAEWPTESPSAHGSSCVSSSPTGPKPVDLTVAATEVAEIPERSLIGAADALGVRSQRGQWRLPLWAITPAEMRSTVRLRG